MPNPLNKANIISPTYQDQDIAHIPNFESYKKIYDQSTKDSDKFWSEKAERLYWFKKWHTVSNNDFTKAQIKWFEGGKLNVAYNC